MIKPKVIKTEQEYDAALARIEALMDAKAGTAEGDELELLSTLVESYEDRHFPVELPDPIEAIRFRMEQSGLRQQDLVRYIGSRSKVSEVLHGKRPLSLKMIRALHSGLGIPAEVLLQDQGVGVNEDDSECDWRRFPIREMIKRGWIAGCRKVPANVKERAEGLLRSFFKPLKTMGVQPALFRQHVRSGSVSDEYALTAWCARALMLANTQTVGRYDQGGLTDGFLRQFVALSYLDQGPLLAREFLLKSGIHLVVLRHLPKTHLDGAVMLHPSGNPVIALTLRHDRLDNFWFTACHELGHIALHLGSGEHECFVDDLDNPGDILEDAADEYAANALIPTDVWARAKVRSVPKVEAVRAFAESLRVHPAIVAGRIRWERNDWRMLSSLVGRGAVRKLLKERKETGGEGDMVSGAS